MLLLVGMGPKIAALVIFSDDVDSILMGVTLVAIVLLIDALDFAVFRNMDKLSKHLDPSRLSGTEAVLGVLLAALTVQWMVDGLAELGIITAVAH